MAPQVAAHFLQRPQGGRGVLLGRIESVPSAEIVVLGGGAVGSNAVEMAQRREEARQLGRDTAKYAVDQLIEDTKDAFKNLPRVPGNEVLETLRTGQVLGAAVLQP